MPAISKERMIVIFKKTGDAPKNHLISQLCH